MFTNDRAKRPEPPFSFASAPERCTRCGGPFEFQPDARNRALWGLHCLLCGALWWYVRAQTFAGYQRNGWDEQSLEPVTDR